MRKYIKYLLILGLLAVIFSMGRTVVGLLEKGEALNEVRSEVEKLKKEQEELLRKKEQVQNDEFIEKEAREKLGLAKEDETVVVLPKEEILKRLAPKPEEESTNKPLPIWRRWVEMFFRF